MFATMTSHESYAGASFQVAPSIGGFFDTVVKMNPSTFAHRLEAWAVEGAEGCDLSSRKMHEKRWSASFFKTFVKYPG
ncbi:hypothetical protein FRC02_007966 [Tulasnella sp. 418]|nr:hypothetical protein FRC02_007966 [Tulasnella sp. 418]